MVLTIHDHRVVRKLELVALFYRKIVEGYPNFTMIDYVRETAAKSCKCVKYRLFVNFLFMFS